MQVGMRQPVAIHFGANKTPLEQKAERLGNFFKAHGLEDLKIEPSADRLFIVRMNQQDWSRAWRALEDRPENKDRQYYLPYFEGITVIFRALDTPKPSNQ